MQEENSGRNDSSALMAGLVRASSTMTGDLLESAPLLLEKNPKGKFGLGSHRKEWVVLSPWLRPV